MALYAIGDVQGCHDALLALLDEIGFDAEHDRLWFTGDLVNRGPMSAEVLRFVMGRGERALTVLGNHDLHLLAVAEGAETIKKTDTFRDILEAPDREDLLGWLRQQPLLHHDAAADYTLVHAGIWPLWGLAQARNLTGEVEQVLRGDNYHEFFLHMYGNQPAVWDDRLTGWERLRFITNACTRMRFCGNAGQLEFTHKGPPGTQPVGFLPWYEHAHRQVLATTVIFGHWATLPVFDHPGLVSLDSGCLWGGALTAVRLQTEGLQYFHVDCEQQQSID